MLIKSNQRSSVLPGTWGNGNKASIRDDCQRGGSADPRTELDMTDIDVVASRCRQIILFQLFRTVSYFPKLTSVSKLFWLYNAGPFRIPSISHPIHVVFQCCLRSSYFNCYWFYFQFSLVLNDQSSASFKWATLNFTDLDFCKENSTYFVQQTVSQESYEYFASLGFISSESAKELQALTLHSCSNGLSRNVKHHLV
jgi:hypothetical protein